MAIASEHLHGHRGDLQLQNCMLLCTQIDSWRDEPNNLRVALLASIFLHSSIKPLAACLFFVASLQFRLDTKYSPGGGQSQHTVVDKSISTYT
jgi:hypothetical protein